MKLSTKKEDSNTKPVFFKIYRRYLLVLLIIALILCIVLTAVLDLKWKDDLRNYSALESEFERVLNNPEWSKDKKFSFLRVFAAHYPYVLGRDIQIFVDGNLVADSSDRVLVSLGVEGIFYICNDADSIDEILRINGDLVGHKKYGTLFSGTMFEFLPGRENLPGGMYNNVSLDFDDSNSSFTAKYSETSDYYGSLILFGSDEIKEFEVEEHTYKTLDSSSGFSNYEVLYSDNIYLSNVFQNTNYAFVIIYITIFILCALIALIISIVKYYKVKAEQDILMYKNNLTEVLAHDLKTPLMAINTYTENIQLSRDEHKRKYYTEKISENVFYMNELISNTMKLSKTYTSKNSLLVETISIKDLVDEVLSQFDSKISSKNLRIELKINDSSIDTDKSRMKNAISCLIDNAVKYAISGSIVEISNASGTLTITNSFNGQISNSDKLKEAFVRGDNSRKELDGSGLGLAISNNELKTLGFSLKIEIVDDKFIVKIVK